MIGVTLALREAREVYHPWYARPGRLFLLLLAAGLLAGWLAARLGCADPGALPRRASPDARVERDAAGVAGALPAGRRLWPRPPAFSGACRSLVAGITLLAVPGDQCARGSCRVGRGAGGRRDAVAAGHARADAIRRRDHGPAADRDAGLRVFGAGARLRRHGGVRRSSRRPRRRARCSGRRSSPRRCSSPW